MIYNVVFVSGVQQSDSVIHMHIPILFQILFPYKILPASSGLSGTPSKADPRCLP